jgi:hypothetical protein
MTVNAAKAVSKMKANTLGNQQLVSRIGPSQNRLERLTVAWHGYCCLSERNMGKDRA